MARRQQPVLMRRRLPLVHLQRAMEGCTKACPSQVGLRALLLPVLCGGMLCCTGRHNRHMPSVVSRLAARSGMWA